MFEGANEFQNGVLIGLARNSGQQIAGAERVADRAMDLLEQAKARIAQLELEVAISKADVAGLSAQLDAYKSHHPQSPLLGDSGQRFASGKAKTKGRLIWEATFDRVLKAAGIANPLRHRSA